MTSGWGKNKEKRLAACCYAPQGLVLHLSTLSPRPFRDHGVHMRILTFQSTA